MFRRLFWLVAGVAIGVWGTTKANRAARRLTPEGLAETAAHRAAALGGRVRRFTDDVRAGMAEREAELARGPRRAAEDDHGLPVHSSGQSGYRKDDH